VTLLANSKLTTSTWRNTGARFMTYFTRSCHAGFLLPIVLKALLIAAATTWCSGQTPTVESTAADPHGRNAEPILKNRPRYIVAPGDVLAVSFPLSPEYDQLLTVAPDGFVGLRGIGDISVGGKSLPELRAALRTAYAGILNDPLVNVDLKDFQKPHFTVAGEVTRPGRYDIRESITLAEGLAVAGGMTKDAKSSQVLLFRRVPGTSLVEVRKLNMKSMLQKGDLTEDVCLKEGDMLFVPKSMIGKIDRFLPTTSLGIYASGIP
jgi:protein involved in polysaccharide export with SLBB domain